jgi:hypothetical protein
MQFVLHSRWMGRWPSQLSEYLPEQTTDDTDDPGEGWNEEEVRSHDDELLEDVPPHHDS